VGTLKITTWNIEHMRLLFPASGSLSATLKTRRDAVASEIRALAPDLLCVLEGPPRAADVQEFCAADLAGGWTVVTAPDGQYRTSGTQWVWHLVRSTLVDRCSLQPQSIWKAFAGDAWDVHYWGDFTTVRHRHFRSPQTLVLDWEGTRVELIACHLKSKFVFGGEQMWRAGGEQREAFIRESIKARIKLTTEAANVRAYIDRRFEQSPNPAIFVLGDLNDGPGKEWFEDQFLFFDLLSNIQGDVFFAQRFLNHCLFDFADHLRWTVQFSDFVQPDRHPNILLDHILFTQPLVNGVLPLRVNRQAGLVEHEVHELVNAQVPPKARTSDHRPVSVVVTT
jgi:hypothetical protein